MNDPEPKRLREPPASRFEAIQHVFDLQAVAAILAKEPNAGEAGRRQETLYKRGTTTIALFRFGHLTRLAPHRTKGIVAIHVLSGRLRITTEAQEHDLGAGHLLVLASGVEHGVVAYEESVMLLTVHLDPVAAGVAAPPVSEMPASDQAASARAAPAMLARALDRWENEGGHAPKREPHPCPVAV